MMRWSEEISPTGRKLARIFAVQTENEIST